MYKIKVRRNFTPEKLTLWDENVVVNPLISTTQGKIGVYANLENMDALTCFVTFVQNKLLVDRKAQTVAGDEKPKVKAYKTFSYKNY